MSLVSYRITMLAWAMVLMGSSVASAQHTHDEAAAVSPVVCGTQTMDQVDRSTVLENTRLANPELYRRIVGRGRGPALMGDAPQGTEWTFLVRNRVTNVLEEIQATLVYDGIYSRVWVDNRDTGKSTHRPTSATMRTLFRALDTAVVETNITPRRSDQGILKNDIDVFGQIPETYQVEFKTDFLLLDIQDAVAGQNVLGYFSPTDQMEDEESNRMNLLYIDSKEGFQRMQTLLAIIAHEFQHLIHYGRHNRTGDPIKRDVALNEGMSEVASLLNGYRFRGNNQYLANTNIEFFDWHFSDANDQEVDYQRAMTFAHYLSEHFGERLLYDVVGSPEENMARVTDALRKYGMPEGFDYKEVLRGFAVANYLPSYSTNLSFRYNMRLGGVARAHLSYTGTTFPAAGSASVQSYGTYYVQYTNPGPMRLRFSGSGDIRAMLMGIRSTDTTVVELQPNTDYDVPVWAGGPYLRTTIAFVNTAGGLREVNWTAQALTSSADQETAAEGRLTLLSPHDNGDGTMTLDYVLPVTAATSLELFDMRGQRVATFLDSEPISAGAHDAVFDVSSLPNGSYVARLAQSGVAATRMVFVAR